jgi:hypothetical protein
MQYIDKVEHNKLSPGFVVAQILNFPPQPSLPKGNASLSGS